MKKTTKNTKSTKSVKPAKANGQVRKAFSGKSTKLAANTQKTTIQSEYRNDANDEGALKDLFIDLLKDVYWAEKYLVKKLPTSIEAATTSELKKAFNDHLSVTKGQVNKVEQVFESIGEEPMSKKCLAMKGLVEEIEEIIDETDKGTLTRDVGLIIAAQKVEHYEIAAYGGLAALAKVLGYVEAGRILAQIMNEEKEADLGLSKIAENKRINAKAFAEA